MIDVNDFLYTLKTNGIEFFTGVPDSFLNGFCNRLLGEENDKHIIAPNEGSAIAMAVGHYIAKGSVPLVYMQNSGLGNAVNPLVSLADKKVYGIPLVLLIGWRGEPGTNDWVQHERQGEITIPFLKMMDIPTDVISENTYKCLIPELINIAKQRKGPVAIVVPKGMLDGDKQNVKDMKYPLSRNEAINTILDIMPNETFYLATTGRATRELFYLRKERGESGDKDFLNVGAMGHTLSIGIGLATAKSDRNIVVFDGDSASIMHMGAMAIAGSRRLPNLLHIVLNNGSHESVGGQPSVGYMIDFSEIARSCGYQTVRNYVSEKDEIISACRELSQRNRSGFLEIRIHKGMEKRLPPLDFFHKEAVDVFMRELDK